LMALGDPAAHHPPSSFSSPLSSHLFSFSLSSSLLFIPPSLTISTSPSPLSPSLLFSPHSSCVELGVVAVPCVEAACLLWVLEEARPLKECESDCFARRAEVAFTLSLRANRRGLPPFSGEEGGPGRLPVEGAFLRGACGGGVGDSALVVWHPDPLVSEPIECERMLSLLPSVWGEEDKTRPPSAPHVHVLGCLDLKERVRVERQVQVSDCGVI
jgi:hypothetical protein